jgi:hypothetical protein
VAVGEPHLQPRYQTATKNWGGWICNDSSLICEKNREGVVFYRKKKEREIDEEEREFNML